jgi:serine/threonine protein kinase
MKLLQSKYFVERELAHGSYGDVLLATDFSANKVVIKKINQNKMSDFRIQKEIQATRTLKHPNIVKYIDSFQDAEHYYIVLDYLHGTDLLGYMEHRQYKPTSEDQLRTMFRTLVSTLRFSHKQGIIHRDIKLENVMVDQNFTPYLLDFGLCEILCDTNQTHLLNDWVGTSEYCAPEILMRKSYDGFASDVWSLGVLLYTMIFIQFPFGVQERDAHIRTYGAHPNIKLPGGVTASESVKDLLQKMLQTDPAQRCTLDEVLQHPWVKGRIAVPASS